MRILYDSKLLQFKSPFGTLTPNQVCTLNIHVPASVQAKKVLCILNYADGDTAQTITMEKKPRPGCRRPGGRCISGPGSDSCGC